MKDLPLLILIAIIFALFLYFLNPLDSDAKQYDVPSYHKERIFTDENSNERKCYQFFSYHDGKEHYVDTVCP